MTKFVSTSRRSKETRHNQSESKQRHLRQQGPSQQECDQLLKYGYGLSRKALYPSNLERQDVKLALQIFNDYLPEALRALGAKHNLFSFEATATFIDIVLKWWKIVNVKTPWKGERLRDQFQQPVLSIDNDPKIAFLHMFLKWLDEWKNKGFDKGTLTKETHAALEHTTYALIELARYSFEELGMSYVLFGKIQTDCLEDRFGKYRQLAGAQYHISIRHIYEVENKLRLQSTLPTVSTDQHWEYVRGFASQQQRCCDQPGSYEDAGRPPSPRLRCRLCSIRLP